jgi:hypothetical protein
MCDEDILKSLGIVIQTKKEDKVRVKCSKPHGGKIQRG